MIQVYADDELIYDSRLSGYELTGLKAELGLNKGGTAAITMPPSHPAYSSFVSYKTLVRLYRNGSLLFRGRALYPSDDFYKRRTITCEGERCFFCDAVMRAYLYQAAPRDIFADVIKKYNEQVEEPKRFEVGEVTVSDPNNYIRFESDSAEQVSETIDKLVERCGGYIIFTNNADGKRTVNWFDAVAYANNQTIEFGENLLDFARSESNTDLATAIIPYGAKNEETDARVTIKSVNGGVDYIQDDEAVALRGFIIKPIYWDDITKPANLLKKAQQYLTTARLIVTTLELTAVDLSTLDKRIDSFREGDLVRVKSKPHGVDDDYLLTTRNLDLLNPANDRITLGKSVASLTGLTANTDKKNATQYRKIEQATNASIEETKTSMSSAIKQTSEAVMTQVATEYATNDSVQAALSTSMTQLSDSFEFQFTEMQRTVNENDAEARAELETIKKYIRFEDGNIILGEAENEVTLRIENDRIGFLQNGAEVAYFSNRKLYVIDGEFLGKLKLGNYAFEPQEDGSLTFGLDE